MPAQLTQQSFHAHTFSFFHRPCLIPPPGWHHATVHSHPSCAQNSSMHPRHRGAAIQPSASQDSKQTGVQPPSQQQQQPERRSPQQTEPQSPTPLWAQQLQQTWEGLDTAQKGYTVAVILLLLAALPKVLTLLVLGLERVLIGGLLAAEEVLLEVLFRSGAVLGLAGVIALVIAGVYLFLVPKATK